MSGLRHAVRALFRTPFVTVVAVVSLALGIGANAAIFSLFEQLLLRPLPVDAPDRLVNFAAPGPKPGGTSCDSTGDCDEVFSYPMLRDLENTHAGLSGIAAHKLVGVNLAYRGETLNSQGVLVSGGYFQVLGLIPTVGRLLRPEDDQEPGASPVVVLGHDYWRTRFDANSDVVNQTLIVNGQAFTIVGVAPAGFNGTNVLSRPQVFIPLSMRGVLQPNFDGFDDRRSYWVYLFARLEDGVTLDQAHAAINVPYAAIINDVEVPLQEGMSEQTMARFKTREILVENGRRGQSDVEGDATAPLLLLFGVTGLVLLIACSNIANLLLARGANRSGEMAVRLSLGASRWHLVKQLLTEATVLAALGGIAGLFVANWTLGLIGSLLPAEALLVMTLQVDETAILFVAALTIGTGFLFGLYPAVHSTRPDLISSLKEQAGQPAGTRSARRFRTALATVQIGLSMVLLVSAGLFTRSLVNVSRIDLGLDLEQLITFGVSPALNGYEPQRSRDLFERLEADLAAIPGVTDVAAVRVPLLGGSNWGAAVTVEGFEAGPDTDISSRFNHVGAGYFWALGNPLLSGREFSLADRLDTPKVAIVNEQFARKFDLGNNAVGMWMSNDRDGELDIQIIGLARNAKYSSVKDEIPPLFFLPYQQNESIDAMTFYIRSPLDVDQLLATVPQVVAQLDPNLPVENLRLMEAQIQESIFIDRIISVLSAGFAGLATLLAAIGLYGVLAYTVAQRTREIGLRMALGADAGRVQALILRQVGWMTLIGGTTGLALALGLGRVARSMLFELEGHDPVVLIGAVLGLALVAGAIPALRASRIDPMRALRYE